MLTNSSLPEGSGKALHIANETWLIFKCILHNDYFSVLLRVIAKMVHIDLNYIMDRVKRQMVSLLEYWTVPLLQNMI